MLLLGLYRLAARFINREIFAWVAVFISILIFNDKALGNVDLYTPSIQAADVACAMIIWAINYFLDRKYILASFIMSVATLIHVLEGLDVMILLCLIVLILLARKELSIKTASSFFLIYFVIAFPFLFMVLMAKSNVVSTVSNHDLFAILFEFRHPHHFIFSSFPVFNKLFFFTLAAFALIFYRKKSEQLFWFVALGVAILFVYIICTDYLHLISMANFQWYKTTQWIKFIGIVAFIGFATKYIPRLFQIPHSIQIALALLGVITSWTLIFSQQSPFVVPYQIANFKYQQPEIDIAIKAKNATPKDAVFVIPFSMSEFKYWSERSAYVEFKANARNKMFVEEWYKRIGEVYGIDTTDTHSGFEKHWPADKFFYNKANSDSVNDWKKLGVTNIIINRSLDNDKLSILDSNEKYFIYKFN